MTTALARKKNQELPGDDNTGKMIGIAVGTVAVVGLIWWLTKEAKAAEPDAPTPPPPPPGPEPGPLELYVSDDCKVVKEGSNWFQGWAGPKITEAVYAGMGAPILSNDPNVLNKSMNAVVRALLQPWAAGCVAKVPWPDWYVADNPVPVPKQGQSRQQFYALMDQHRDKFINDDLIPSLEQYPQFNALIGKLSLGIIDVYMDRYWYVPGYEGVDEGGSQTLSTVQKSRLRKMGYDITDNVVELFQSDFNTVMVEWVGGEWYSTGKDIPVSNQMDNATDDALTFAFKSSVQRNMPWAAMVAQATGTGPDYQDPKEKPNA